MSTNQGTISGNEQRRHKHEGPQKHIFAFIFSLVLTLLAFAVVASGEVNRNFTYFLLMTMAILQVIIQLAIWMHMKDRGHTWPIIFITLGVVIASTCVVMGLFWVWW
jgi:cytochrome c oxidase subunit 4